ncbi:DNA polymerase III, delta subunit [Thiohalospira halophila DSM 15071]|uniref:DNA polymerase III subunit delta n=1 Tax=Thiohalospira halophila DSM 15071 TaxID=1123397 RepID=A0A1I1R424_9GAMM|nr:DNA polymerase III subunit delta [Thiohalospira halophila]SFD26313.1 DNA polymerase III, delta subunit [Thiohalospira halophila DSM 15071]
MRLQPEQLPDRLASTGDPIYLVSGDEPFQLLEAADAIRAAARERGNTAREVFNAGKDFDWSALTAGAATGSLFGDGRLLEVRLDSPRPGEAGARALREWAANPPPDAVLLLTLPKLDRSVQQSKWFRELEAAAVWVPVWPVTGGDLRRWLAARLTARGLEPEEDALTLLAERTEGNLPAAAQEVDRLALIQPPGPLNARDTASVVTDSARFDLFDLGEAALAGEPDRAVRVLEGLREEGTEAPLVLWVLAREARIAAAVAAAARAGEDPGAAADRLGVWKNRRPVVIAAARRLGVRGWRRVLSRLAGVDDSLKGGALRTAWDELLQLALIMAGRTLFPRRPRTGRE